MMLENLFSTKMSAEKKHIQNRFTNIRFGRKNSSKFTTLTVSVLLILFATCAGVVAASVDNTGKNLFIDGKGHSVDLVLIENALATQTDSYYVPLRSTFEALGYEVNYDVNKKSYARFMGNRYTFPAFDAVINDTFIDENGVEHYIENAYLWQKELVTCEADYYIYGATASMNWQMPIIEMKKDGVTEFCQIGSRKYSKGYANAPVLIEGVTYIPLRAVAYMVGGDENVKWDFEKGDTCFKGVLTFDTDNLTIFIRR